jgi:hypothetical protein
MNGIKTFERWCEDNGRVWQGCRDFAEFARNATDYEAYRERAISDAAFSLPYAVRNLNLPPIDGGGDGTS